MKICEIIYGQKYMSQITEFELNKVDFPLQVHITVGCASVSRVTWVPAVSARRARRPACTSAPVAKRRANRSAAGEESAAAASVSATNPSLAKSMGATASVITSPVPDTKASSAQVGITRECLYFY